MLLGLAPVIQLIGMLVNLQLSSSIDCGLPISENEIIAHSMEDNITASFYCFNNISRNTFPHISVNGSNYRVDQLNKIGTIIYTYNESKIEKGKTFFNLSNIQPYHNGTTYQCMLSIVEDRNVNCFEKIGTLIIRNQSKTEHLIAPTSPLTETVTQNWNQTKTEHLTSTSSPPTEAVTVTFIYIADAYNTTAYLDTSIWSENAKPPKKEPLEIKNTEGTEVTVIIILVVLLIIAIGIISAIILSLCFKQIYKRKKIITQQGNHEPEKQEQNFYISTVKMTKNPSYEQNEIRERSPLNSPIKCELSHFVPDSAVVTLTKNPSYEQTDLKEELESSFRSRKESEETHVLLSDFLKMAPPVRNPSYEQTEILNPPETCKKKESVGRRSRQGSYKGVQLEKVQEEPNLEYYNNSIPTLNVEETKSDESSEYI